MSHHIYTTPGFIVHSAPHGEAGKYFLIFTRELGMISATAQGVRFSQSKLRYHIQDYSSSLFSVVKGKEVWRVTGAKEIEGKGEVTAENRKLYVRILSLLKRLVPGEEKNEKLFEVVEKLQGYLCSRAPAGGLVEYVTVLRILHHLGYISNADMFMEILSDTDLNDQVLNKVSNLKDEMVREINRGLKESQL